MLGSAGCAVAPPPVTPVPSSLSQAHRGIKGMVVDKFGKPVRNARVSVKGIRHDVTAGELLPELAAAAAASTSACRVPGLAVSPSSPCPRARRVPGLLGGPGGDRLGTGLWSPRLRLCGVGPGAQCAQVLAVMVVDVSTVVRKSPCWEEPLLKDDRHRPQS